MRLLCSVVAGLVLASTARADLPEAPLVTKFYVADPLDVVPVKGCFIAQEGCIDLMLTTTAMDEEMKQLEARNRVLEAAEKQHTVVVVVVAVATALATGIGSFFLGRALAPTK